MNCRLFLALSAMLMLLPASGEPYDLIIRGGLIADGTGNPAFHADVAIKEGRIVAVGRIDAAGKREIDAKGSVVAPGFIDVHTHADEIAEMPEAENFLRMGVTTIVAGNCGSSTLEVGKWFADAARTNVAVNFATLIGHNDVRRKGMGGDFDRPPTAEELEAMKSLVDQAMKDGAIGFSTGLIYLPGAFGKTDEIIELAKVAARYDGIYTSHMRHEDKRIYEALDEVFRVCREAGLRGEVSHIKLSGPSAWGQANQVLEHIEKARQQGLDVTQDQYSYTASSTGMSQLIPDSAMDGGRKSFLERLADPEQKKKIVSAMIASLQGKGRKDYSYAVIASYRHDPSLNGLNLAEAARKVRGGDSLEDQVEMVLEIQKNGGAGGVFHGMSEDDLQLFMRHPNTMVACDSGLRKLGAGVPHPRGYGNNARVLARYVRELHVLRLEDAIRKMTSLPAATFHFKDRGLLREGAWADIVVFELAKVADVSTYRDPHHYAAGFAYVFVNGIAVIDDGRHTRAKAGQPLRNTRWSADPAK